MDGKMPMPCSKGMKSDCVTDCRLHLHGKPAGQQLERRRPRSPGRLVKLPIMVESVPGQFDQARCSALPYPAPEPKRTGNWPLRFAPRLPDDRCALLPRRSEIGARDIRGIAP